jgi:hypothetical protein
MNKKLQLLIQFFFSSENEAEQKTEEETEGEADARNERVSDNFPTSAIHHPTPGLRPSVAIGLGKHLITSTVYEICFRRFTS